MKNKIRFLFIALISIAPVSNIFSQATVNDKPSLTAVKIEKPIELTGKLDNPVWEMAMPVEINYEIQPGDNTRAAHRTIVKALYDDNNIYFGFECFDSEPEKIRANITFRDNLADDDYMAVFVDTYGDYNKSAEFNVNPYGIQADALNTPNSRDPNVDWVWNSAGSKNSKGWTAEIAIPFSSLNFFNKPEQTWVVGIIRNVPRESRIQNSWTPHDRNIPNYFSEYGFLKGLKNIKSGSAVELLPYIMGQKSGYISDFNNPNAKIKYEPLIGRFGGSIKYSPSPNFTLDAVINPDFSQIESDAAQISVNTTFALQYEEKRPFFLTGGELLQTPMYYSRSINDPIYAGKITGKSGALNYLYMSAQDRNTILIIPGEEASNTISTSLNSFVNIGRVRYDFGNEIYLGGMVLARNMGDAHNYVVGFDWNYKFLSNWYFSGEMFLSQTKELNNTSLFDSQRKFGAAGYNAAFNGENYAGAGVHLVLSHIERNFGFNIVYNDFSPTYQTYNGMFPTTGYRQIYFQPQYILYSINSFIDRLQFGFSSNIYFNYEGVKKTLNIQPRFALLLKGQTQINVLYNLVNEEKFFNKDLKEVNSIVFNLNSQPLKEISIYLNAEIGNFIYRISNPVVGRGHNLSATLQLKPTPQFNISLSYTRANLHSRETEETFFDGDIYRGMAIYQFSPEMMFRTILQYNSFNKTFQLYPLFSYKVNAFTTFFAGATSNYFNYEGEFGFKNTEQQYFVKAQYLLGI